MADTNVTFYGLWHLEGETVRLSLLGIVVPPIGMILLVEAYILKSAGTVQKEWRSKPFISWAIGAAVGFVVEFYAPQLSTAISAGLVAAVAHLVLSSLKDRRAAEGASV